MIKTWSLALALGAAVAGCGGNSESECRPICEWWQQYCTGESFDSCMSDCQDADEDAATVEKRCVDGDGWGTPSSCQSASCCVRFVYDSYYYDTHC